MRHADAQWIFQCFFPSLLKLRDLAPESCENTLTWAVEEIPRLRAENHEMAITHVEHCAKLVKLVKAARDLADPEIGVLPFNGCACALCRVIEAARELDGSAK